MFGRAAGGQQQVRAPARRASRTTCAPRCARRARDTRQALRVGAHGDAFVLEDLLDRGRHLFVFARRSVAAPSRTRSPASRSGGTSARTPARCSCRRSTTRCSGSVSSSRMLRLSSVGTRIDALDRRPRGFAADVDEDLGRRQPPAVDLDRVARDEARRGRGSSVRLLCRRSSGRGSGATASTTPSLRAFTAAMSTRTAAVELDAPFGGAARHLRGARAGHQRLGRDAADVDAGAAQTLALDEGGASALRVRSRTASGGPAWPAPMTMASNFSMDMMAPRSAESLRVALRGRPLRVAPRQHRRMMRRRRRR